MNRFIKISIMHIRCFLFSSLVIVGFVIILLVIEYFDLIESDHLWAVIEVSWMLGALSILTTLLVVWSYIDQQDHTDKKTKRRHKKNVLLGGIIGVLIWFDKESRRLEMEGDPETDPSEGSNVFDG